MFAYGEDNGRVPAFEQLLKSLGVDDLLDEIASANPPAFLRRCFAEGLSSPRLADALARQVVGCAIVLDAVVNEREYPGVEPELIADWRVHYGRTLVALEPLAVQALRRAVEQDDALSAGETGDDMQELQRRLGSAAAKAP
jgi:hypothetical protein